MAKLPAKSGALANQRCFNHINREAVARCPQCKRYFCRECVTEHHSRLICSKCLTQIINKPKEKSNLPGEIFETALMIFGLILATIFFGLIGSYFSQMPGNIHEGVNWFK